MAVEAHLEFDANDDPIAVTDTFYAQSFDKMNFNQKTDVKSGMIDYRRMYRNQRFDRLIIHMAEDFLSESKDLLVKLIEYRKGNLK